MFHFGRKEKMKKLVSSLIVLSLLLSVLIGCNAKAKTETTAKVAETTVKTEPVLNFKLAENQSAENPVSKGMQKFAELVKAKTNGTVTIDVYLDAQLGTENETIDQIQAGTLDFARVNTSAMVSTADAVGVFTLPYIFTSIDQKYKVLDGSIGKTVSDGLTKYNMIGLEYWEAGSRCFYTTKKPVTKVADLKGMKIRVQQSDVAIKMVELLGAAATPMSYGEVYQGLQTGVIDGAENDFVSYYTSGHYEVSKYYALDGHMAPPAMLLMSQTSWNKMSSSQQAAVREAAKEAAVWQRQAMQDYQGEARAKVEAAGSKITEVDTKEFQNAVAGIYDKYPQYAETITAIKAIN
jgi:tripartite ATP-independent transporter DctP family solute receptor